jgi:predicted dehydrogenase
LPAQGLGEKIHIPGFQAHPGLKLWRFITAIGRRQKRSLQSHNIPQSCDRLEDILAIPDVTAVSISTPPFLHYEMAKSSLASRKTPVTRKTDNAESRMRHENFTNLPSANGVVAMMDFEFRFVPAWQLFAEYLAEGYVGQKRLIKIDWLVSSRADASRPWNWYAQKDKGGGALGAVGSHAFDYISWLFGSVRRLCAQLSTAIPERPDPTDTVN